MNVLQGLELTVAVVALGLVVFFSLIESAISQSGALTLRMFLEKPERRPSPLLPVVLEDKGRILVPLYFGTQTAAVVYIVLTTHLCLQFLDMWRGLGAAFAICVLVTLLFRQFLPRLLTQGEPERKLSRLLRLFRPFYLALRLLVAPVALALSMHRQKQEEENGGDEGGDEEATEEEIHAYLQAGEDEGIIEEEDSRLIQSVVEFGNTLVREVMTPRTKIVACEEATTLSELCDLMVRRSHSRIPVYRGDIDHIVGVVYIRRLMAQYIRARHLRGGGDESIAPVVRPVLSVPETKPVAKLLKELQERGDHVAIVIDEFGGVAGMVTVEDLVEEIVGEIWDEDEVKVKKVVAEDARTFVVHGSAEISDIDGLAEMVSEEMNCSTVAGLVIAHLGRVPATGETFELEGVRVQILDADMKKIHRLRIRLP
ncbi:MAG: hemolysin family protein [Acidobacteriota bacterium]|jgi:CBS domain containing-hemolysin-like protein|nr:hemolysin family protein [Acidobacteriota bacterium]